MDKTTTWLVRGAAVVVIGFGAASLFSQTPEQKEQAETEKVAKVLVRESQKVAKKEFKKYCSNECLTYKYKEFKQAVTQGEVKSIVMWTSLGDIFVELKDGKKAKVALTSDPDLFNFLKRNNVEINVGSS